MIAIRPDIFANVERKSDFHFYLGTALVFAMFLEIGGIITKTKFIYSRHENRERKIPIYLTFSFVPRLLVASGIVILSFIGMGFFNVSDFILLPIVIYAVLKEFWVRGTLLNSDVDEPNRISRTSVLAGEVFLYLFVVIVYTAMWELVLLDSIPMQKIMAMPVFFPLFGLIFLALLLTVQMPYLLEEAFRKKKTKHVVIHLLSFLLPVSAFVFDVARIGLNWNI